MPTTDRYLVGRQPIWDADLQVHGYQLRFRGEGACPRSDDAATADVLVRAGLDSGLAAVVGEHRAWIAAPRSFLLGDLEVPLPPEQVVLEVPSGAATEPDVLTGCERLAGDGFGLALDGWHHVDGDEELLELAGAAKVDVATSSLDELEAHVALALRHGATLVACGVDTHEQLSACRELGFELFQGQALGQPDVVEGRALAPNRVVLLRLVERICDPATGTAELEELVESDPGLAQRLLRVAGAGAAGGARRGVRSIREAVVLLGRQRLRSWLVLMLTSDARPASPEHLSTTMVRAKMSELLMAAVEPELQDSAFTVGLVSGLDTLLGARLRDIVAELHLADPLVDALLERSGLLGQVFADVLAWELGQVWLRSPVPPEAIERGYLDALRWTQQLHEELAAG